MTEPSFLRDTRASYDTIAELYADMFREELARKPFERATLGAFAELVRGPVVEVGSGPGRVSAYLNALGVTISGLDLSPAMVALARREHPGLTFDVGSMTAIDRPDGSLGGVVAWYSLIHVPPDERPTVLAEFRRVLVPGGQLLCAFQVGDEPLHRTEAGGHQINLMFHRIRPDHLAEQLVAAGFVVTARLWREADESEKAPQGHVLARKPNP